jgi:hypothetical protein
MLDTLRLRWPLILMLMGVSAWLWPLGVGGRMPVGGDVTAFQIGLMAEYQRALHSFRLPLWNANWGYGFPGLAESQMGVYYPPHVILYGLLPLEAAYTASLVLHTFWAAIGTLWCVRRMGSSLGAGAFAGFVWATCGFFVIHITHQWGYTSASWMPWAWGLAWTLLRGNCSRRTWLALAAVLAIQVLPGHFQLAFITQTTVLLIGGWSLLDAAVAGVAARRSLSRVSSENSRVKGCETPRFLLPHRWAIVSLLIAWMGVGFLAACQLRPTWDLARSAETSRTFDYLSGFAQSPIHLVSYVAPGMFHGSPLWRAVAWDPLHTSPEESLGYVGLVPLWLAMTLVWRSWRQMPDVRLLAWLFGTTLLLSMGPFIPGFEWLIQLPGFSFFRAPARWGAATMLALALLSGFAIDHVCEWARVRGSVFRFILLAAAWPLLLVGVFELALKSTDRPGLPAVGKLFERARSLVPWKGDPSFRDVMAQARSPSMNPITLWALARRGVSVGTRLADARESIYFQELMPTGLLLVGLLLVGFARKRPPESTPPPQAEKGIATHQPPGLSRFKFKGGLIALTVIDLLWTTRLRDVDTGPIQSLMDQSPVLRRLAEEARTTRGRVVSGLGNLPMVAGAANVPAYRTLDIPVMTGLTRRAQSLVRDHWPSFLAGTLEQLGATLRIVLPTEPFVSAESPDLSDVETISDPALARWISGEANPPIARSRFRVFASPVPTSRFVWEPGSRTGRQEVKDQLDWRSPRPDFLEIDGIEVNDPRDSDRSYLEIRQTPDPEWAGVWKSNDKTVAAKLTTIKPEDWWTFTEVPGRGSWRLELRYEGRAAKAGLLASAIAWGVWTLLWFEPWRSPMLLRFKRKFR